MDFLWDSSNVNNLETPPGIIYSQSTSSQQQQRHQETSSVQQQNKQNETSTSTTTLLLSSADGCDTSLLKNTKESQTDQNKGEEGNNNGGGGFVNGNFFSGQRLELQLPASCFVLSFHNDLLVVGTATSLCFYDAVSTYTLIHQVVYCSSNSMISAVKWIPSSDEAISSDTLYRPPPVLLLATADLSGCICLYSIDVEIIESQGPTLIFQTKNATGAQIRSLDAGYYYCCCCGCNNNDDSLMTIVAGDKNGDVTICLFDNDDDDDDKPQYLETVTLQRDEADGILGLALQLQLGFMATSTKSGLVQVDSLLANVRSKKNSCGTMKNGKQQQQKHSKTMHQHYYYSMQRSGPVRCVSFSPDGSLLAAGGYDKTVVLVDTNQWAVARELPLQGTVNTLEFDPKGRYLGVGCRDKTFTVFDTSTYVAIKVFPTPSWVTSISWRTAAADDNHNNDNDHVAVRSASTRVSILDLSPIQHTRASLGGGEASSSSRSLSWSRTGEFLARSVDASLVIVDSCSFDDNKGITREVASFQAGAIITRVACCPAAGKTDLIAVADESGYLTMLRLRKCPSRDGFLEKVHSVFVEPYLKALSWSQDGSMIVTGGRGKRVHIFDANNLRCKAKPLEFQGRIWDIDFVPKAAQMKESDETLTLLMAVALGDYSTVILDDSFEPALKINRSRTCRCLRFHPTSSILAIGDGAGAVAIVDYVSGEIVTELDVEGRVNVLDFSPCGDFVVMGTDECHFAMYESSKYQLLQEFPANGFALTVAFAPTGRYLALGSADGSYDVVRLGPFLGIEFIPLKLKDGVTGLPAWVLNEALYRSGDGPSFLQRQMIEGSSFLLPSLSFILHEHPNAIYSFDRQTNEGCFDTALRLKKPSLLKLMMTCLVDGTLDPTSDREKNFLDTNIPQKGRETLLDIVMHYPPDYIVEIFNAMTFMKVPFTGPRVVNAGDKVECGSRMYIDPWTTTTCEHPGRELGKRASSSKLVMKGGTIRTPAVLPLPGLGDKHFIATLLERAPPEVFDSDSLALVLRVLWEDHIRIYFYIDCLLFAAYYACWIVLVELASSSDNPAVELKNFSTIFAMALAVLIINTLFAAKELVEVRFAIYWRDPWNVFDIASMICVYVYASVILFTGESLLPLGVVTTLLLTVKLLSYLRGFSDTGWLISVLSANFRDVRGFLIILFAILVGFAVAFRLLFADTGDEGFGSLRRSFLSTFELTITGTYDPMLLFDTMHTVLTVLTFILAITCVLVVALNALISILADSYARVQEKAVANRRRAQAALIVDYMSLIPPYKRCKIETEVKWIHTLLEVDADGSLQVETDDWEGGINALRRDMEELARENRKNYDKALALLKSDLNSDTLQFKKEVIALLEDLADDVKHLRKTQTHGLMKFDAKQNAAKAVKAVRSIGRRGGALLKPKDT